jgi:hypothetical protein
VWLTDLEPAFDSGFPFDQVPARPPVCGPQDPLLAPGQPAWRRPPPGIWSAGFTRAVKQLRPAAAAMTWQNPASAGLRGGLRQADPALAAGTRAKALQDSLLAEIVVP